jgi:hypothetical protein
MERPRRARADAASDFEANNSRDLCKLSNISRLAVPLYRIVGAW